MLSLPNGFLNPARKSSNCSSGVGGGGAGGANAPPKVLICQKFGQNPWKFGQNLWKSGWNPWKSRAKSLKSDQKWRSTFFDFKKWRPTFAEKHSLRPILEVTPKTDLHVLLGENWGQKVHKSFSGKFGEIRAKILRTPRKFACSYTYELLD